MKKKTKSNETEQILKTLIQEKSAERKFKYAYEKEIQHERREERKIKQRSMVSRKHRIRWEVNATEL